jgi:succinate dehydrogenase hydrophobic anchor subunit
MFHSLFVLLVQISIWLTLKVINDDYVPKQGYGNLLNPWLYLYTFYSTSYIPKFKVFLHFIFSFIDL